MSDLLYSSLSKKASGTFVAAVYLLLGLADLLLSLAAFRLGIVEGNPFLAHFLSRGLFIPAKLTLTVLVTLLIVKLYTHRYTRPLCWAALLLMALVDAYHVLGITRHFSPG